MPVAGNCDVQGKSRRTRRLRPEKPLDNITGKVITELEADRAPWGSSAAKVRLAMPRNAATVPSDHLLLTKV